MRGPLIVLLAKLPKGTKIMLRAPRTGEMGSFEAAVESITSSMGITTELVHPGEGDRAEVYRRDYAMIERSDYVMAFFTEGEEMHGGTGHVVEAALAKLAPVYAWSVSPLGHLERVGEYNVLQDGPP
jgi:nucleoside 2-deoxyribosyltransferase